MTMPKTEEMRRDVGASKEILLDPSGKLGARHMVAFMLFLGMANAYIMRTNMSVAIVAMVNHTALPSEVPKDFNECAAPNSNVTLPTVHHKDGIYVWNSIYQNTLLTSFFYGYVVTQIPFGILSKKYGSVYFLGVGMLINSVFAFLVPVAAEWDFWALVAVRFIQGLGEGPIVPCTHAILAKWIPPNERSRVGAFVYAGAQFGTVISMPLSGLLAEYGFSGGWPSIFYVFGLLSTVWSLAFLFMIYEDPESHPHIDEGEKKYIVYSVWGNCGSAPKNTPWKAFVSSSAFWAILIAHMGHNYGYETLLTQLPTFMRDILHFDIKSNGFFSALPYLAMWLFSMAISFVADAMISSKKFSITSTRKIINGLGQYGPAVALICVSFTGCSPYLTVFILTVGMGLNGSIYSGFKVNHLDISPRYAGILMSFTNCLANFSGLLAPNIAGILTDKKPTQEAWRKVFLIAAGVYIFVSTMYILFASGERQSWDESDEKETAFEEENGKKMEEKSSDGKPYSNGGFSNTSFDGKQ